MSPERDDVLDEPIDELAELRVRPSPGFLERIRGRIHRRSLALNLLDMTWSAPAEVILQFLDLVFGWFGGNDNDRGGDARWNKKDSEKT